MIRRFSFLAILVLVLISCASTENNSSNFEKPGNYDELLDRWTQHDKAYRNLSSTYQVTATLLSPSILEAQLLIDADQFKWSQDKYQEERQKVMNESQAETQIFMSLYTESDENNNPDKASSNWNIFLDSGGQRLMPSSIRRVFINREILLKKYPYHTVWNRAYIIKFPAGTNQISTQGATLTLAGPLGSSKLKYPR